MKTKMKREKAKEGELDLSFPSLPPPSFIPPLLTHTSQSTWDAGHYLYSQEIRQTNPRRILDSHPPYRRPISHRPSPSIVLISIFIPHSFVADDFGDPIPNPNDVKTTERVQLAGRREA